MNDATRDETDEAGSVVTGQRVTREKQDAARRMRRAMTPAEAHLWECLRGSRLGAHFRRQQIIEGFIADFYCHSAALVVEVDGGIHQGQAEYDAERDRILLRRGLTILRLTNEEITTDRDAALARIRQALAAGVSHAD
ncbi:MAG: DUF559 domain-containing protein [Armatimonadota bacterium]|nr:DUF559 domain-containing protein [Armatimonadota bacterium]